MTGANSDIGLGLTKALLTEGCAVFGQYHSRSDLFSQFESHKFASLQADLTDISQAKALTEKTVSRFGGIDILINLIGPFSGVDILSVTPLQWRSTVELNLNVAFTMSHFAKDHLIERKGQILNFCYAGVENIRSWTGAAPYAAAKAGLAVMTKSFATALAPFGVRVNAICPGYINFGKFSDEEKASLEKQIPAGRLGNPEEIVQVARWLIKDSPAYLNGAFLPLGGVWEHSP